MAATFIVTPLFCQIIFMYPRFAEGYILPPTDLSAHRRKREGNRKKARDKDLRLRT